METKPHIRIRKASEQDIPALTEMASKLLQEIQLATHDLDLDFDVEPLPVRRHLEDLLERGSYRVLVADSGSEQIGFAGLFEGHALYAGGALGTITELFVKPQWREKGVGRQLLAGIFELARRQGWRRVEVTTPPLPEFERIMHFYQCEGFAVTGGRKLRRLM